MCQGSSCIDICCISVRVTLFVDSHSIALALSLLVTLMYVQIDPYNKLTRMYSLSYYVILPHLLISVDMHREIWSLMESQCLERVHVLTTPLGPLCGENLVPMASMLSISSYIRVSTKVAIKKVHMYTHVYGATRQSR